jgi:hypothetical protein
LLLNSDNVYFASSLIAKPIAYSYYHKIWLWKFEFSRPFAIDVMQLNIPAPKS